ncbi:MAG: hypothetical protein A2Z95_06120 [Gallionellales bacterium GWA2_60_18]|nr:MAG: hypothetical protein A2Z95_06120 [Gallionellales bacterium GWA2_60_18]
MQMLLFKDSRYLTEQQQKAGMGVSSRYGVSTEQKQGSLKLSAMHKKTLTMRAGRVRNMTTQEIQ